MKIIEQHAICQIQDEYRIRAYPEKIPSGKYVWNVQIGPSVVIFCTSQQSAVKCANDIAKAIYEGQRLLGKNKIELDEFKSGFCCAVAIMTKGDSPETCMAALGDVKKGEIDDYDYQILKKEKLLTKKMRKR